MQVTLMPARPEELEACAALMAAGRTFQRAQGFVQWTEDYPNGGTVLEDVRANRGYVLRAEGRIAGYLCLDFAGEPAYADPRARWTLGEPYAALHRVAVGDGFRGRGLLAQALELAGRLCVDRGVFAIRANTDPQNLPMRRALEKSGFQPRGTVWFQGGDKLAYERPLAE